MKLDWKSKKQGVEEATGNMSVAKFKHKVEGEGNSEHHTIEIEYSNGDKFLVEVHGEWEFNEFKEFISKLKTNPV